MDKDKINNFEFCSLIPMLSSSAILGSGFLYLYNKANNSALISMLIGLIISAIFLLIIFKLFNTMPEKTLPQKIKTLVPKWLYYVINIILVIVLLTISSLVLYRLVSFFNTQFLTDLPKFVLSFVLILLPLYASTKNIEALSRFSSIAVFICLFTLLFNAATLASKIEINNLKPIIDTSLSNILISSFYFSIIFAGPSFLLLSVPKANISNPKKLKKYVIISYILTGTMLLIINISTLGALGIDVIKLFIYPAYIVLKKIQIFEFINSIENIAILLWFFFLIITSSLSLLFSKNIFYDTFKIKSTTIRIIFLVISIAFIALAPIIFFSGKNITEKASYIIYPVCIYGSLLLFAIILLILDKVKKK